MTDTTHEAPERGWAEPRFADLVNVAKRVRHLERLISDMEWEDQDPTFERRELEHYHALAKQGQLWEPLF